MTDRTEPSVDEFAKFVHAVHGHTLFPWQEQIVDRLLTGGQWPSAVDVPTGLGKTTMIDVAVYMAAYGGPRRVFFVVDRRIIVDEAHDHAQTLATALREASSGVVADLSAKLAARGTALGAEPVNVTRMRGGVSWEWRWVARPDQVSVVVGTIDQIGSRMLFRGYGTSPQLAPIDAALVGTDSLLFLDEAHLAEPFLQTLHALREFDQPEQRVAEFPRVVQLSATTRAGVDQMPFDLAAHLDNEEAARRLTAGKRLSPVTCAAKHTTEVMATYAHHGIQHHPGGMVLVMANTVARARELFTRLRHTPEVQVMLLTGRSRPWDRQWLLHHWLPHMRVGWRHHAQAQPTRVIIATQTLEVGANIDADFLVTEAADYPALVQRLGRLNRVGRAEHDCQAIVVQPQTSQPAVVYGDAQQHTWTWLTSLQQATTVTPRTAEAALDSIDGINVSPRALREMPPPPPQARRPAPRTPTVVPQHVNGWVRTAPIPIPDAPIGPFLHGISTQDSPVGVLWRADLPHTQSTGELLRAVQASVERLAPRPHEIVEIPLPAVRAWLRHQPEPAALADVDTADTAGDEDRAGRGRRVVRLAAEPTLAGPDELAPGDVIAVPDTYGGLDDYGWNPTSTEAVLDVADLASGRRSPFVRLHPRTLPTAVAKVLDADTEAETSVLLKDFLDTFDPDDLILPDTLPAESDEDGALTGLLERWWNRLRDADPTLAELPTRLVDITNPTTDTSLVLAVTHRTALRAGDNASSQSATAVQLDTHQDEVADLATRIAKALGLDDLATEIGLAARWHDLGKLDLRLQAEFHGGDHAAANAALATETARAKSGLDPADRAAFRAARRASGYPLNGRHEALSAHLAQHLLTGRDEELDRELVVHLIGAHHGHNRPLYPPVHDPAPPQTITLTDGTTVDTHGFTTIDWASPARFARLNTRYGPWGLALLETIVRLADIACSAGEYHPEETCR
ncbi:type I-U CRISPR-associated helicase/endonuclease Cas3 [Saccharopolyspora sp. NPDC050389]|uniref:type I-G CRISPR-associated helicase/endonuclease Cas3g n=1 Tax=Saccharopolyspora sp. NPDC050389 TaxID=3155516 RepID=UPI0033DD12B2